MAVKLSEIMGPAKPNEFMKTSAFTQFNPVFNIPTPGLQQTPTPLAPGGTKEGEDQYSLLSKAFKAYSNAIKTPGFNEIMGTIATAFAPNQDSWQAKVGQFGMQQAASQRYSQYVQKLVAGQEPTADDARGIAPEMQLQARQVVEQQKLKLRAQGTDEKSQAASQKYMEAMSSAQAEAQRINAEELALAKKRQATAEELAKLPDWQATALPVGGEGEYKSFLYDQKSGKIKDIGEGKKAASGSANVGLDGLTPAQRELKKQREFNNRRLRVFSRYSRQMLSLVPDANGILQPIWKTEPDQATLDRLANELDESVRDGIRDGKFEDGFAGVKLVPETPTPTETGTKKQAWF